MQSFYSHTSRCSRAWVFIFGDPSCCQPELPKKLHLKWNWISADGANFFHQPNLYWMRCYWRNNNCNVFGKASAQLVFKKCLLKYLMVCLRGNDGWMIFFRLNWWEFVNFLKFSTPNCFYSSFLSFNIKIAQIIISQSKHLQSWILQYTNCISTYKLCKYHRITFDQTLLTLSRAPLPKIKPKYNMIMNLNRKPT